MSAIVIEDKLESIFGLIPSRSFVNPKLSVVEVPKPTYDYGGFEEYNALLKERGSSIYPLIFQRLTRLNENDKAYEVTIDLELIIAKNNKNTELRNPTRWKTSYRNILMPLVNNIVQAFNECGIVRWTGEYGLDRHPNYAANNDEKDSNASIDIIDAVVFTATITVLGKPCVKKNINFNN